MSHAVKLKTEFRHFAPLTAAFATLGWKIVEKAKINTYRGDPAERTIFDYVAKHPNGGYDLGINIKTNAAGEPEIDIIGDTYGGTIEASLGCDLTKLKMEYAYEVIKEQVMFSGATDCTKTVNNDGTFDVMVQYPD